MKHTLTAAVALLALIGTAHAADRARQTMTGDHSVVATQLVPPPGTGKGWQGIFLYTVPTGTVSLEFTYGCPATFPVTWSGGYEFVGAAQANQPVYLTASAPRLDEGLGNGVQGWGNHFYFPNGALAGTQIQFDAFCNKGE